MAPSPDLLALVNALLLGEAWTASPAVTVAVGEELRTLTAELMPYHETDVEELARVRRSLIDFGALQEDDTTTGTADLIDALLPPMEG
jgi:hypothetical protein